MPGPLVNISAIILRWLHDAVMDGRVPGAQVPSSCKGVYIVYRSIGLLCVTHFGCGGTQSLQGLFRAAEVMLAKVILGKEIPLYPNACHFISDGELK